MSAPTRLAACAIALLLPAAAVPAAAVTIDVEYSQRVIPSGTVPDTTGVEGGYFATLRASEPVELLGSDPAIEELSPQEYRTSFVWNWPAPRLVRFRTAADETVDVEVAPVPTYPFDTSPHTVPIVHVRTDSTNLWDPETGIYVWGNHRNFLQRGSEWERPATLDFYGAAHQLEFSEPIGIRINGEGSRYSDQKSLRIYFDDYGTADEVDYDFFGSDPTSFRRLITRMARWPINAVNSNFIEGMFRDLGNLGSRYAFCVVYLNDEYWGCYSLRERYDEEFVEHTHGYDPAEYVLIKDLETVHGDGDTFWAFLSSFGQPHAFESHAWFTGVESQLDLQSYVDWLFLNVLGAAADNGFGENLAILRGPDGRWRILDWDQDSALRATNLEANHLRFYAARDSAEFVRYRPPAQHEWSPARQEWCTMFNRLLHNSEFKAYFFDRVDSLLAGPMSPGALTARLEALRDVQGPEMEPMHADRWRGGPIYYEQTVDTDIQWVVDRWSIVAADESDLLREFRVPVELSRFDAATGAEGIDLTWRTESEIGNAGFVVTRSVGSADAFVPIATYLLVPELVGRGGLSGPTDYAWTDPEPAPGQVNHYRLEHMDSGGATTVHDWIESISFQSWDGVVVNEFGADNDTLVADEFGDFDDWIEIANAGADSVLLDGAYLTDDLGDPTKHLLGGGLVLPPGGRLLLWADGETAQGPAHLGFKLSGSGEAIGLFRPDGATPVDTVTFGEQFSDKSTQRWPDATGTWTYSFVPSPGAPNVEPHVPRFLALNELMARNAATIADEAGDFDPWVEIGNPLPVSVPLLGLSLTDDPGDPTKWALPDASIPANGYALLWADGEPDEGPGHASFALAAGGGSLGLADVGGAEWIDQVVYPGLGPDSSFARIPDGDGPWTPTGDATPGARNVEPAPTLFLNEFLASNDGSYADENGDFDDWLEIWNPASDPVPIGGLFLTDDLDEPQQWMLPDTTLAPGAHLVIWCDEETGQGPLHADFKLGAGGEEIGLFGSLAQGNVAIDTYVFGEQSADVSEGRAVDGAPAWAFFPIPTPGQPNAGGVGVSPGVQPPSTVSLAAARPSPFRATTVIEFALPARSPVTLAVFDVRGRCVRRLAAGTYDPGRHRIAWDGRGEDGRAISSGVYFARLRAGREERTRRLVLVR